MLLCKIAESEAERGPLPPKKEALSGAATYKQNLILFGRKNTPLLKGVLPYIKPFGTEAY